MWIFLILSNAKSGSRNVRQKACCISAVRCWIFRMMTCSKRRNFQNACNIVLRRVRYDSCKLQCIRFCRKPLHFPMMVWGMPAVLIFRNCTGHPVKKGIERLRDHYVRANFNPTDEYVLSVPKSAQYRIRHNKTGFCNLSVAGDWTYTGVNAGCVEGAVMSGKLASNNITQWPPLDEVVGFNSTPWAKP